MVYNYCSPNVKAKEENVIYLMAHRGHLRFAKQSRITTGTLRDGCGSAFGQVIDVDVLHWDSNIVISGETMGGSEGKQC